MSLINQMLRDLQQRRDGGRDDLPVTAMERSLRPRRRYSGANTPKGMSPLLWVGAGGLAGILLLWGVSGGLSGLSGSSAPVSVSEPPPEPVAIAKVPQPLKTEAPVAVRRQAPPVPLDVPSPAPPRAYASTGPAMVTPEPVAVSAARSPAQPVSGIAARRKEADPSPVVQRIPGMAPSPPGRLHPGMLPGAVNATNLALQRAAREAAVVQPPVVTLYGQAEAAYQAGRQAYEANRIDESMAALHRALGFYPGHLPARELLVDQIEMAGRPGEAFTLLKQGLAIAPDYTPFRKRAARLLLDRDDAAGAIRALVGSGLPRIEDDPELHQLLADIYQQLGETFLAAQTYRNLLVHDPQNGSLWIGLGDALTADGQSAEARRAYRRALATGGLSRDEMVRAGKGAAQP